MSLHLPSEIVVERLLPTVRARLAGALADRGMTQAEVAEHLGVSQAAVSKYISGDVEIEEPIWDHPATAEAVTRIAEGFASGGMDGYESLDELLSLVHTFEDRGPVCELHEKAMPSLAGLGCDLCIRGSDERLSAERETLTDVRSAARILARAPAMASFVPNVGTNVGCALPRAGDTTEVAAVPGRIYAVDGRVEIPANPEFGASRHVATVVLAAMARVETVRGAVNLVTDEPLLSVARDRGLDHWSSTPSTRIRVSGSEIGSPLTRPFRGSSITAARSGSDPSPTSSARRRWRPLTSLSPSSRRAENASEKGSITALYSPVVGHVWPDRDARPPSTSPSF